jgi:ATP-independent RNA helicase DbpA
MIATNETQGSDISLSFSSLTLRQELINNLPSLDFINMTFIQAQSLPKMLEKQDVIAQAKTGSGKTVAFGLALLNALSVEDFKPQALILCPTRELAEQVAQVLRRLARLLPNVKVLNLSGGIPMRPQLESLKFGAHIIVGTPGRIQKHLETKSLSLSRMNTLVLDEADKMLDMGFLDAIENVISYCPSQRQTLLFSATFSTPIKKLAKQFLKKPYEIQLEEESSPLEIEQIFFEVKSLAEKYSLLKKILSSYQPTSTLIFCNTKEKTRDIYDSLKSDKMSVTVLNGDLDQSARDEALVQFSNHSVSILVATDVAARGLDIKELPMVINFELPFEQEVYIHRIGRTGRAGCEGKAITLTLPGDAERLIVLEKTLDKPLSFAKVEDLPKPNAAYELSPPMKTLRLSVGRKDKIRPGDILGALTKDAGLLAAAIGKIEISATRSYVAIKKNEAKQAYDYCKMGKIKGKKRLVALLQ